MNDDYLWDPSAPPDPEVERLERLLGRLRSVPPVPALPERPVRGSFMRTVVPLLATAAAIIAMIGVAWQTTRARSSWEVAAMSGQPRVETTTVTDSGRIAIGQTLVTDYSSQARITVATIGEVTVDPNSRVRLVDTRDGHHQLALERGTLRAVISAPPGQFIVDTPSARATDLGCSYTLHVDEDGSGLLNVTAGWVALSANGRESLVPSGAFCRTDPTRGPGTPWYEEATEEYRRALEDLDYSTDPVRRTAALRFVLEQGGNGDAMTLWHLLSRVETADRGAVIDALADQLAMPEGVTREAIMRLDATALDRWWEALGLGNATWWRQFRTGVAGKN